MKQFYLIVTIILSFFLKSNAQEGAIHIAIIPFSVSESDAMSITDIVQEQVAACFVNKNRFYLLDRGVTEKLKKELDAAKDNGSLYARVVAEQGHLAGAQYLITGKVSGLSIESSTTKSILSTSTTTQYHGSLHVTIQINSVETGQVIEAYPFTVISKNFDSNARSEILENVLCKFQTAFRVKVRNLFSSAMVIVKVEKEKNGIPEKVLINAGKELFETGKDNACGEGFILSFPKKIALDVIDIQELNFNGTKSKREKKIGELKIDNVEGDFTVCSITKGDKEIKEYLDANKILNVKLQ